MSTSHGVSTIIARADARNKIIDFRDNLSLPNLNEYAMLHSIGGSKRGYKSTIKCSICDYSAGTGSSVTVYSNFDIDTIYFLYQNASRYLYEQSGIEADIVQIHNKLVTSSEIIKGVITSAGQSARSVISKHKQMEGVMEDVMQKITDVYRTTITELGSLNNEMKKVCCASNTNNFTYKQDRVDVYKRDSKSGTAPVTITTIVRTDKNKDGEKMRAPWCVKITTGIAPVREQKNGTSSYVSSQLKIEKECFINLSDYDMFRCLHRVIRFVELWENTMCIPMIAKGESLRQQERIDAVDKR